MLSMLHLRCVQIFGCSDFLGLYYDAKTLVWLRAFRGQVLGGKLDRLASCGSRSESAYIWLIIIIIIDK